jgi:hypothetical protein
MADSELKGVIYRAQSPRDNTPDYGSSRNDGFWGVRRRNAPLFHRGVQKAQNRMFWAFFDGDMVASPLCCASWF